MQNETLLDTVFSMALAEVAGLDPALVVYEYSSSSWGVAFVDVFLIEGQSKTAMQELINGTALEEIQARLSEPVAYPSFAAAISRPLVHVSCMKGVGRRNWSPN